MHEQREGIAYVHHSSFSFFEPAFDSCCRSFSLPVSGLAPTADGPPMSSNALWKTYSVACSTGSSNMNGRAGTAARPSCFSSETSSTTAVSVTYSNRPPRPQCRILRILQCSP